jgi:membrane associated rhomboid family serine protease
MFFPIGDDDTSRRTVPLVTYALIALNVLFFFVELSGGDAFIMKWAFVPSRFLSNPFSDFLTLFTSMFACQVGSPGRQHALLMDLW